MGRYSNYFSYTFFLITLLSCTSTDVEESLNELNYTEAKHRLAQHDVTWKFALLNNKIAFEAKKATPIKIDSILNLVKKDTNFTVQNLEKFYRTINFFHPQVSKQLLQIEIEQNNIIKSSFFTTELLNLLKSKNSNLHSFAFEQFYQHLNPSNSIHLIPEIKEIKKYLNSSFKDSLSTLISHLFLSKKTSKGIFLYKHIAENNISQLLLKNSNNLYRVLISGASHNSYQVIDTLLKNDSIKSEYKRALISSFNHNRNDSLAYLINEQNTDLIQLKLLTKVKHFSNFKLLQKLFRLHNINEHLQRKSAQLILKWKKDEVRKLLNDKLYSESQTELIHAIYFAGMYHFREFKDRINELKKSTEKLIKYEAERASYRLN